jgi:glycosyltransferase involved in cell wall biosynthesis
MRRGAFLYTQRSLTMKIGVDARTVFAPHRRGTGKTLVSVYTTLALRRPGWQFVMFNDAPGYDNPFAAIPNIRVATISMPGYRWNLWQDCWLPLAAVLERVDVLHCPANSTPRMPLVPALLTIHDLIPVEEAVGTPDAFRVNQRFSRSATVARRILVPSGYTGERVVKTFGVPPGKVVVNHWAADPSFQRVESQAELHRVLGKYGVGPGDRYVLVLGATDPRKNTESIIRAWHHVAPRVEPDIIMLVVGIHKPHALKALQALTPAELAHRVRVCGFADEHDMPALFSGAEVLCYASRSEGFGLPVLDAFSCGTPVVTSGLTSLPEVAGGAALLVDPLDTHSIGEGLLNVLSSPELHKKLVLAGRRRLQAFSWTQCADTLAEVLQDCASQARGGQGSGTRSANR